MAAAFVIFVILCVVGVIKACIALLDVNNILIGCVVFFSLSLLASFLIVSWMIILFL